LVERQAFIVGESAVTFLCVDDPCRYGCFTEPRGWGVVAAQFLEVAAEDLAHHIRIIATQVVE
jgi:hypothetical protein